jgi:uncharacterized OsmC-like protein
MDGQREREVFEMTTSTIINGLDTEELKGAMDALKDNDSISQFNFRVNNKWINGGHNHTSINEYYGLGKQNSRSGSFELDADEPPALFGEDHGANPVEHLLHSLAACVTTSMVYHAAARGIEIQELESTLEGDLDLRGFLGLKEGIRPGYRNIRINFRVKSDAPVDELRELCKLSPVYDMVTNTVPVDITVESK